VDASHGFFSHTPPLQRSDEAQLMQMFPPVPQNWELAPALQTLPAQQPEGQVLALHGSAVQMELMHCCPEAHWRQDSPFSPQVSTVVPETQVPWELQHPTQLDGPQPGGESPLAPQPPRQSRRNRQDMMGSVVRIS